MLEGSLKFVNLWTCTGGSAWARYPRLFICNLKLLLLGADTYHLFTLLLLIGGLWLSDGCMILSCFCPAPGLGWLGAGGSSVWGGELAIAAGWYFALHETHYYVNCACHVNKLHTDCCWCKKVVPDRFHGYLCFVGNFIFIIWGGDGPGDGCGEW